MDNSGNTLTHALLSDSPAKNAGNNAICAAAPVNNMDQRGGSRPQSGTCDLGAYEEVRELLRRMLVPFVSTRVEPGNGFIPHATSI